MNIKKIALFGNPVYHSKSPIIHKIFSYITNIPYSYNKINVSNKNFNIIAKNFFDFGGYGANITLPFKKKAFYLCDLLTERAKLSKSVNVITKINNKYLLGDNTDGIGFINDLKRLYIIYKKKKILIIGAGGAARGIIPPLLLYNNNIIITNRTLEKAKKISKEFNNLGNIKYISNKKLFNKKFDIIINATSCSIKNKLPNLFNNIINSNTFCYDMVYSKKNTYFLKWCLRKSKYINDGLGMLISQAAYSFLLWHNKMPSIKLSIEIFKKINYN
ncbi:Shikimate dehydrogenase [Candidatus Annandia adelgestsuga]|uniref:Shikimate dehydrogenase (NADP(+)) n=1 Tax=Candidatus Annandia adelgestsuga TaxID=1302411 RepID=A0A3Q9CLK8_9ENTR|nr:shikimate dehydrogenase [Candidatus Annandia adelgestsuga]AZP36193.1 Shikimate dehydrogenase [Candidatus Annandia adelgestsuga]